VNILARIISFIFHPLLMATYLFTLLSYFLPSVLYPINSQTVRGFLVVIIAMTFLLPAVNISLFRIFGTISSFTMVDRRERIRPFFSITIIYCFVTYFLSFKVGVSPDDSLFGIFLIIDCLIVAATMITFFYKISVHSIGMAGVLGIILPLNRIAENNSLFIPTVVILVVTGLVMSARLQLNAHTSREVWYGALVGFLIGFIGTIILF
jgi:hypothetical protein